MSRSGKTSYQLEKRTKFISGKRRRKNSSHRQTFKLFSSNDLGILSSTKPRSIASYFSIWTDHR